MKELIPDALYCTVGDITKIPADAMVNAANSTLLGGLGVDGAIHKAGGPGILAECQRIRNTQYPKGLPAGQAVETTAGNLPAKIIIHTVGPIWHGDAIKESNLLRDAYSNSMRLAVHLGCKSISFPAISTGAYGFPKQLAAQVSMKAIMDFLSKNGSRLKIILVFFHAEDADIFITQYGAQTCR